MYIASKPKVFYQIVNGYEMNNKQQERKANTIDTICFDFLFSSFEIEALQNNMIAMKIFQYTLISKRSLQRINMPQSNDNECRSIEM